MRTVIKGLLMAVACLMIMGNIASAEMPDPAIEVEQYLAGEDWQAVGEYSAAGSRKDGGAGDLLLFGADSHAGGRAVADGAK